jgi:pantoate--beta-alanine ligase
MEVFESPSALQKFLLKQQISGKTIGFVPTMGALHEGHLSLIKASIKETDFTVASIFVNPLQFNNKVDLELYPRNIDQDLKMLESAGCDLVFLPSADEIYKESPKISIQFGVLEEVMEGKFRPGHFNGVAIVVSKLFHFVNPDHAYFGQKDLQQFAIISQLVKDLSFPLTLHCCPIFREPDGLAMSSRNVRIPKEKRATAGKIYEALQLAKTTLLSSRDIEETKNKVKEFLKKYTDLDLEYFEIVDSETLQPVEELRQNYKIALCIAVYLNGIRLIDNVLLSSK